MHKKGQLGSKFSLVIKFLYIANFTTLYYLEYPLPLQTNLPPTNPTYSRAPTFDWNFNNPPPPPSNRASPLRGYLYNETGKEANITSVLQYIDRFYY